MKFRRCMRNLNIERSIFYLVAASFLVWIVLGVYLLSSSHAPREPGQHSGHKWRIFREDDPNPKFRKRPALHHEKLTDDAVKTQKEEKQKTPQKKLRKENKPSIREKLEQIHKKKLADAGFRVDYHESDILKNLTKGNKDARYNPLFDKLLNIHKNKLHKAGINVNFHQEKAQSNQDQAMNKWELPPINYNVHLFYYPWYGNPATDGKYFHWNHRFLPHWNKVESIKWPLGDHKPPEDIGANFYPALGPYSSSSPETVEAHMAEMRSTGAGVVSVSWYPPGNADSEGIPSDKLIPLILDKAHKHNMKVNFHIEPYKNRNPATLRDNLKYIINKYGNHSALYRTMHKGKNLPLYYIYDSYNVQAKDWAKLFQTYGEMTVRGTDLDGIFIGLLVEKRHREEISMAGFDGFYSYFASNGFTYGSLWRNWGIIHSFAKSKGLLFIPSVGPGYVDTRVRPWNSVNTKGRDHGQYYESAFTEAVNVRPPFITITSYNEWHEGTQIESAIPKRTPNFIYEDYEPEGSKFYINITRKWVMKYAESMKINY